MRDHIKGGALTETTFFILLSLYSPNHGYGITELGKSIAQIELERLNQLSETATRIMEV